MEPAEPAAPALVAALAAAPVVFLAGVLRLAVRHAAGQWSDGARLGDTLGRAVTWDIAWFTLWQAAASTALTVVVGLAPAYVLARYRFAGRRLLAALLTAAFVLPTVVMGAAVLALCPAGSSAA